MAKALKEGLRDLDAFFIIPVSCEGEAVQPSARGAFPSLSCAMLSGAQDTMETRLVVTRGPAAGAVTDLSKRKRKPSDPLPAERPAKHRRGGLPGAGCGVCSPGRGAAFPARPAPPARYRLERPGRAGSTAPQRFPGGPRGGAPSLPPLPTPALPAGLVWPPLGARLAPPIPCGSGGSGRSHASHLTPRGGAGVGAMSRRERGPEPEPEPGLGLGLGPGPGPGGAEVAAEDAEPAEPESPDQCLSLLPWDRFSAWLHCVCVVGFDLELGQAVEVRAAAGGGTARLRAAAGPRRNRALPLAPLLHRGGGSSAVLEETWLCGAPERVSAVGNRLGCPG